MSPSDAPDGADLVPAAGEHPYDLTMTFARRLALRRLAAGQPLGNLDTMNILGRLVECGLVGVNRLGYVLTVEGRAYLASHAQAATRPLPRPAPPQVPAGWSYSYDSEAWVYEGRLSDAVIEDPGPDDLEADLERAEATLALLKYLRADRAYQSRAAGVTTAVCPPLERSQ